MCTERPVILVADDDPAVRDSLKFSLELEGVAVRTFGSGIALLADSRLAQAGCLILDYKMPEMNAFDVLEELGKRRIQLPVVLIVGPVTANIRERALRAGITHIIEKPLLDTALIDCIHDIIGCASMQEG